ncbi:MAG: DMT family transporter [Pirellula sp.]
METNPGFPTEIVQIIQSFIDKIDQELIDRDMPRVQRNTVCDEVELQIHLMIERKLEMGSELTQELVASILESIDQPESYRLGLETSQQEASRHVPPMPEHKNKPEKVDARFYWSFTEFLQRIQKRFQREQPHTDPVAVTGLVLASLGAIVFILGILETAEALTVFGLLGLFLGSIASGVSYWRIRNSGGKLLGKRFASTGLLIMPFMFINAVVASILILSGLWMVLGALIVAIGVIYVNYRLIRRWLAWLEKESVSVDTGATTSMPPEESRQEIANPSTGGLAST